MATLLPQSYTYLATRTHSSAWSDALRFMRIIGGSCFHVFPDIDLFLPWDKNSHVGVNRNACIFSVAFSRWWEIGHLRLVWLIVVSDNCLVLFMMRLLLRLTYHACALAYIALGWA
ncbi:hypothetical protein Droror1_Dr00008769 [Drosera rotundifolia]